METTKLNFAKNFRANVEMRDLMRLGWEFDIEDTMKALNLTEKNAWDYVCQTYHIEINVDENGNTFWNYVNSQEAGRGIFEGSEREATGDDKQTIEDLKQLSSQEKLWDEKNIY